MIIRLNLALRQRLGDRERGAATLESVGMYSVAVVLAIAVILAGLGLSPVIGDRFRQAVCMVTTLGQGPCDPSVTSAEDHKPPAPCVVSADGHTGAVEVSFVVSVGENEQFLVEKLNNGKYRVTRATGGKVGVGVGVGANVTVTVDNKTYGAAAKAEAGVEARFTGGETYYADTPEQVSNLMKAHAEDVTKDVAVGGSGPVRWLVDTAEGVVGVGHDFPKPDETYIEGGVSADASAQATFLDASAQASGGVQELLGIRQGANGTSTTYYKASLEGSISAGTWTTDEQTGKDVYAKAGVKGKAMAIVEVERDAKGNITAVRVKSVLSGKAEAGEIGNGVNDGAKQKNGYVEKVVDLPIRSATDQAIAQRYLNAMGMGPLGGFPDIPKGVQNYLPIRDPFDATEATKQFAAAASDRGFVTQQSFDNNTNAYGGKFDAAFIAKVGGGVKVDTFSRVATGAKYWDGSKWATWTGCGGA